MNKNNLNPPQKVAIQGYKGSFHEKAANIFYHEDMTFIYCNTFSELVKAADSQQADCGVMAIENSIAGTILPNYQLLKNASLHILGEIYLQIGQQLMALPGQNISDIKEIHSHHMAIKQCHDFLAQHSHIKIIETEDTALSAKIIKEQRLLGVAAIAGEQAARIYDLAIIAANIETVKNNYTRFLVLNKTASKDHKANKATLLFSLEHKPNSLSSILKEIGKFDFNISKIQSFPIIEKEWTYYFCLDLEYNNQQNFITLCQQLELITNEMRVLGTYQKGKTV